MSHEYGHHHRSAGHRALSPFGIGVNPEDFIDPNKPTVQPDSLMSPTRKAHELGGAALSIESAYLTVVDAELGLAAAVERQRAQAAADWERIVGDSPYWSD